MKTLTCLPLKPDADGHQFGTLIGSLGIRIVLTPLGHDHLAETEIYLKLSPEHVIKESMEKW